MNVRTLTVLRYTVNYDPMVAFYGDILGMSVVESWDRPDGRGTVFAPYGAVANATIEVLELADVCVPGVAPVNVVVDLFVDDARATYELLRDAGHRSRASWRTRRGGIARSASTISTVSGSGSSRSSGDHPWSPSSPAATKTIDSEELVDID